MHFNPLNLPNITVQPHLFTYIPITKKNIWEIFRVDLIEVSYYKTSTKLNNKLTFGDF